MRSRSIVVVLAATSFAVLVGCNSSRASLKPEAQRKQAPTFEAKDSNGKAVTLADYKDRVVLLNFWATWCEPCKMEIPWFMEFETQYRDRGFAVLGVSLDETGWKSVAPFVAHNHINYKITMGTEELGTLYGVQALPTTYMIDRSGRLAAAHRGLMSKATYEDEILGLLEAPQNASNLRAPSLGPTGLGPRGALLAWLRPIGRPGQ